VPVHDARMFAPGAAISGYKEKIDGIVKCCALMIVNYNRLFISLYILITLIIFFESAEGPLLEKIATIGAGL
jgi:hypothetical protein